MNDLKVLHFHFGREGGAERFFVNLALALHGRGVEQCFVIRPNRTWGSAIAEIGPVIHSDFSNLIRTTGVVQWRVRRLERAWRPHAIMAWMPRASKLLPAHSNAIRVTRLGDYPKDIKHFSHADVLVGNAPGIVKTARELGWGREIRTITNFPRKATPCPLRRAAHATPEGAFLVVAGGRFVPRKGLDTAIRAVAKLPGVYLWLLGEGPEMPALRALVSDLSVADRVRFLGWLNEPMDGIAAGDAFLMPSRHEPLGNMLIEAWRAGIPSVSTRSEGPTWFMRDGEDGILTEIDDVDAIAVGLASLRDNPVRAAAYARSATNRIAQMFSEDAIVDEYIALLSQNRVRFDG